MTESDLPQLSSPEFTYFNELKYSVGNDPGVTVNSLIELPLNTGFLIIILVKNRKKAQALATILNLLKQFGNINIFVVVIYEGQIIEPLEEPLTPEEIQQLYKTALKTNRYFKFAKVAPISPDIDSVYPIFSKSVIQFFNDDISDLFQNFNEVAAHVFRDVLKTNISGTPINPSTTDKNFEA
ncbi:hypothetical protein LC085_09765 [Bacillus tianshenii]|uniref:hypothetical protein n=1 Tax=Sutcliffiella tianshenii TaxID=1463404 RepID=UPI001CD3579B|nr:hypothetical protein [Bacillus tianshenii]MCA1320191.1 hypothetical protein [Bacillus tianshenii]